MEKKIAISGSVIVMFFAIVTILFIQLNNDQMVMLSARLMTISFIIFTVIFLAYLAEKKIRKIIKKISIKSLRKA